MEITIFEAFNEDILHSSNGKTTPRVLHTITLSEASLLRN